MITMGDILKKKTRQLPLSLATLPPFLIGSFEQGYFSLRFFSVPDSFIANAHVSESENRADNRRMNN